MDVHTQNAEINYVDSPRELSDNSRELSDDSRWRWNRGCKVCGKREDLKKCTRCGNIFYCSRECQKLDFKEHKKNCHKNDHTLELEPRQDPTDPCPICLDQECDEGFFAICFQCGASFCGRCVTVKTLVDMKTCPMCRNSQNSDQEKLERLEKLLERGVPIKRVYPTYALVKLRINPSDPTAIVYLTQALDRGAYNAGCTLAKLLEQQGADRDMVFKLHQQAASRRIYESQTWLAKHYLSRGEPELAFHWHTRAYENGSLESTKWLADYYLPTDQTKAEELYKQAGENGCSQSIFAYAELMEQKGNMEEAYLNYVKSLLFIPEAYYRLGEMYLTGYPMHSCPEALTMYILGADKGNINCILKLGLIFFSFASSETSQIPQELRKALLEKDPDYEQNFNDVGVTYLEQAIKLGSPRAASWLGDYYLKNGDCDNAIYMYQTAFDLGDPEAYVLLAGVFVSDHIRQKDTPKALYYLGKAVEAGSRTAQDTLKVIMEKVTQLSNDLSGVS